MKNVRYVMTIDDCQVEIDTRVGVEASITINDLSNGTFIRIYDTQLLRLIRRGIGEVLDANAPRPTTIIRPMSKEE